ncbi:hypothetical protein [Aquimarina spongiae]|uniref:Uncharacterized protein n=1 Tax=Aquimarina spongiae TaxID=570521 RepID=A0A1M6B7X1_9FLAO|nr:hypothetical protein [Aquimarina spongiae]SHI44747.1 hypothetical protein SAMN04488508_101672 [Aquimarina spongiae]
MKQPVKIVNFVIEHPFNINSQEGSSMLEFHILQCLADHEEYELQSVNVSEIKEGYLVVLLLKV